jgi:hypothetical protein
VADVTSPICVLLRSRGVQQLAKGEQRRVVLAHRPVFWMPGLALGRHDREWRHRAPGLEGVSHVERLRDRDAHPTEHRFHRHGVVIEHHLAGTSHWRAQAGRLEPAGSIAREMRHHDEVALCKIGSLAEAGLWHQLRRYGEVISILSALRG